MGEGLQEDLKDDAAVDRALQRLEEAVSAIRAAQGKDDADHEKYDKGDEEDTPPEKQPKNLRDAAKETRSRFSRSRKAANGGKPDEGDK